MNEKVKKIIIRSPNSPGVYIFKDSLGTVIYIGKAKKLRNRLSSYLKYQTSPDIKLEKLGKSIGDIEIVRTSSEVEALIIESSLIKKHKPRYNVQLKDDKAYPYIRVDKKSRWPFLEVVRKVSDDGALCFGPYTTTKNLRNILSVLNNVFPLRKCNETVFKAAKRPCINYQMHKCLAPCQGYIERRDYMGIVNAVVKVLKGKIGVVTRDLEGEMFMASDSLDFEEAARIRERLKSLQLLSQKMVVVTGARDQDIDLISFGLMGDTYIFNLTLVRSGVILGQSNFIVEGEEEDAQGSREDALKRFLIDYYVRNIVPDFIYLPFEIDDNSIEEYINKKAGKRGVTISSKLKADVLKIKEFGEKNLNEYIKTLEAKRNKWDSIAAKLSSLLNLSSLLETVECYDMSNISGKFSVGARVFFSKGSKVKDLYRRYKIKGNYRGDDLKMMKEVISRRVSRISTESLADLIVIDGGRSHLRVVSDTLLENGVKGQCLMAIAKDRKATKGLSKDKIYVLGKDSKVVRLRVDEEVLNFIKMVRDEAHRFVIRYHRGVRTKQSLS